MTYSFQKKLAKYLRIVSISISNNLTNRMNILAELLPLCLRIWILHTLYTATMPRVSVNSLNANQAFWVVALCQCFGMLASGFQDREIAEDVKSGAIAYSLLRPYSYAFSEYSKFMGRVASVVPITALFAIPWIFILSGHSELRLEYVPFALFSLVLGATIHFLIVFQIGLLSFWLEETSAFSWIYHKAWIILGGQVIPLSLLPDRVREVVRCLPFSHLFNSASEALVSSAIADIKFSLLIQVIWLFVLLCSATCLFASASRRLASNGG